jgi:hypothetical protein
MIQLGITERMVLLQTDAYRVVGLGTSGYRLVLMVELAHKDALGEVSWHLIDREEFNREGKSAGTDITPDVLLAALDKLMTTEARLNSAELELAQARAKIAEMEEQREDEALEAMEEYPGD